MSVSIAMVATPSLGVGANAGRLGRGSVRHVRGGVEKMGLGILGTHDSQRILRSEPTDVGHGIAV